MTSNRTAHIAGALYMAVVLLAPIHLLYIPSQLYVSGDPAATIHNIAGSDMLFRAGIVIDLVSTTFFLALGLFLHKLLAPVNALHARFMLVFVAISAVLSYAASINALDVVTWLTRADYQAALGETEAHGQAIASLASFRNGGTVTQVFWGLWLFPFGYLVFKSGFLPKTLGVFLMIGCFGYVIQSLRNILFPEFDLPGFVRLPSTIGEIGIALWLLFMGTREKRIDANRLGTPATLGEQP
jgi:hypothetical protein